MNKYWWNWPYGFQGYDSWANWFFGDSIIDLISQRNRQKRFFFEEKEVPGTYVTYDDLNAFWKVVAQITLIKPSQARVIVAFGFAWCNSPRWIEVLYGKSGAKAFTDEQSRLEYLNGLYAWNKSHKDRRSSFAVSGEAEND